LGLGSTGDCHAEYENDVSAVVWIGPSARAGDPQGHHLPVPAGKGIILEIKTPKVRPHGFSADFVVFSPSRGPQVLCRAKIPRAAPVATWRANIIYGGI
jgi:hypothetical protein